MCAHPAGPVPGTPETGVVPEREAAPETGASPADPPAADAHRGEYPHDAPVLLEEDETVPPRPEEEAADLLRAEPDPH